MPELAKNSEYIVTIESYNSDGSGVAKLDGLVIFVKGALRGETCKIRLLKVLRNVAYAKIVEIITPSPHRITPACENFGKCGGCDFMHMDYEEELELKKLRVEDALRRIGGFDIDVPPVVGCETLEGYRNKAIYAIGKADSRAAAGFYRERSHDIAPAPAAGCLIQADVSRRAANAVTRWMDERNIPAYDEKTHTGAVRRVFCRYAEATGEAQVVFETAEKNLPHLDALVSGLLENCPETASIALNINKSRANTVMAGRFRVIWGEEHITDELCGLKFRLSPLSFYQINRTQAERLYRKASEFAALTQDDLALDLYCGAGTITLLLAQSAGRVIGAEIVPAAIEDARRNAELNGVENAQFICADASLAAETLKNSGTQPDVVVVDPPRRGLSPEVIRTIADMTPKRVVYVSCDPGTLARDLKEFRTLGFSLKNAAPFDMFPRCKHIECCCLLQRD